MGRDHVSGKAAVVSMVALALVAMVGVAPAGAAGPAPRVPSVRSPPTFGDLSCPPYTSPGGPAATDTPIQLLIGFVHDQVGLEAFARSVSDPQSSTRGAYLGMSEIARRYGVTPEHKAAFTDALTAVGATGDVDVTGMIATASLTVGQANQLFSTTLVSCQTTAPPHTKVAVTAGTPPQAPAGWVGGVAAVLGLPYSIPMPSLVAPPPPSPPPYPFPVGPVDGGTAERTGTPQGCADALAVSFQGVPQGLAPNQWRHAYGLDAAQAVGGGAAGARAAIVVDNPPALSDIATFAACFGLPMPDVVLHQMPGSSTSPQTEPVIDVSAMLAAAPGITRIDVFVAPEMTDPLGVQALAAPLDTDGTGGTLPDVVSYSYGTCEQNFSAYPNDLFEVPLRESVLAVGAAAGVGYYAAAGDGGSQCLSDAAASTWATGVGGTNLTLAADNSIADQGVWNGLAYCTSAQPCPFAQGAGGGGTSVVTARPWWQTGPGVPAGAMRTAPDVAFFADSFPGTLLYCEASDPTDCPDGWISAAGTSFATPMFAGSMAAMAARARAVGRPGPGFVAPTLYELARSDQRTSIFRDVVVGNNDFNNNNCCAATPAYDLASGWGSVDIAALADVLAPVPVTPATVTPTVTSTAANATPVSAVPRFTG